ncbi:MAG: phosphogluconate dehydratase [Epsilonproteobacteria bacterium]|nr:phosphogluconate dehydratase [Campylobacterota bacterium]
MNKIVQEITKKIQKRSKETRIAYKEKIKNAKNRCKTNRDCLGCSNIAHAIASMSDENKNLLETTDIPNIAIITAYNDMLSAHEPFKYFPDLIKKTLLENRATAQVAGGVPAMCDGITQGQTGMELSLYSRDTIALSTAIALSHNVYDGAIYLGVCDKIVPGQFMAAMSFGHLPSIFMPAGPMTTGIDNASKAKARQEYAKGKISKTDLLKIESASYHSSGTCTFYGTANSNQMVLEMMGLQLPNSSFVNAYTPLRKELTKQACIQLLKHNKPISEIIDEKSFVNAIVGLMATGGSTNQTIHLISMAKSAGIILNWDDFDELSNITPLICKLYPNGKADVNDFRKAGGLSVVIHQLLELGLLHEDAETIMGKGLNKYVVEPILENGILKYKDNVLETRDEKIISKIDYPFDKEGGLRVLEGNIGRSVIKTSALKNEHFDIKAPAIVFESQEELQKAFHEGKLEKDFIAVIRYQGPKANGMPELHGLMTPMGILQDKGFKVGIITDGRMSGASGKVPSAIHLIPEAIDGGVLSKIQNGDMIHLDIVNKKITLLVDNLKDRKSKNMDLHKNYTGLGRELFGVFRDNISDAEHGASIFKESK